MIRNRTLRVVLAVAAIASTALADHPGDDLDAKMAKMEEFFQPLDAAAPSFELVDPEGNAIRLADFSNEAVVLHFVGPDGLEESLAHAEKVAEIQAMINASAMKDLVQFLSISTDPTPNAPALSRRFETLGFDPVNWTLLTRSRDQPENVTRDLARQYGGEWTSAARRQPDSAVTYIVSLDGRIAARFDGTRFDELNAVLYVNGLLNNAQHHREEPGWLDRMRALLF